MNECEKAVLMKDSLLHIESCLVVFTSFVRHLNVVRLEGCRVCSIITEPCANPITSIVLPGINNMIAT